ncbi:unnamed protein product [Spirodela intermedia]|uniref:Uncharacterized protein n=1 Tax=Spirodela intermedia TaxID=51605 RepID=A0A7I8LGL1_SPIIN|nr:unnamed protein product [Spirodela intermedia]
MGGGDPLVSRARKWVGSVVKEEPRTRARAATTDWGTCAPLPFHVTGGQPVVGQGVVVHARERDLIANQVPSLACTTTPCPTTGWPPVMWKGSGAHVHLLVQATRAPTCGYSPTALLTRLRA